LRDGGINDRVTIVFKQNLAPIVAAIDIAGRDGQHDLGTGASATDSVGCGTHSAGNRAERSGSGS
jgi:hypothetical protein